MHDSCILTIYLKSLQVEDSNNNITCWHCAETAPNGTVCKATMVFKSQHSFCLSTDNSENPTWLVNREGGMYTTQHNHAADHSLVTLAKVRMMVRLVLKIN